VDLVVGDEPGEGFVDEGVVMGIGFCVYQVSVGECATDESGGSVADVSRDGVGRKLRLAEVSEGGVDGVGKVDLGVDEGTVEVEDQESGSGH